MDLATLSRAYDRSAASYDERFRPLQREKYRAAAPLLEAWLADPAAPIPTGRRVLDAGAGTGLFAEWLADEREPFEVLRRALAAPLAAGRWIGLDASRGMLVHAGPRGVTTVQADLARPPFAPGSFALVLAFTSVLDRVGASLGALSSLVAPGGALCVSFLAPECPGGEKVAADASLGYVGGVLAGQDRIHLLRR
jgi:SAM-dependent methyltransferase